MYSSALNKATGQDAGQHAAPAVFGLSAISRPSLQSRCEEVITLDRSAFQRACLHFLYPLLRLAVDVVAVLCRCCKAITEGKMHPHPHCGEMLFYPASLHAQGCPGCPPQFLRSVTVQSCRVTRCFLFLAALGFASVTSVQFHDAACFALCRLWPRGEALPQLLQQRRLLRLLASPDWALAWVSKSVRLLLSS